MPHLANRILRFYPPEEQARALLATISAGLDATLVRRLLDADQDTAAAIAAQRERVALLRIALRRVDHPEARRLERLADHLVAGSVEAFSRSG
jgi:hypothetical protein